jgi:macrolide transport system ATP-binding/permease protein
LSCHELVIRNGARVVIERFSWSHSPPGAVWVTGSNGSGKSSLLQVIAGWRRPTAGLVQWRSGASTDLRYLTPGMMAPGALRVGDFVHFAGQYAGAYDQAVDELYPPQVAERISFGKLSTGEAKRLLLWALLSHGNGPLVLDEPYEHLAPDAKRTLTTILRQRAVSRLVMVATNQEVPPAPGDALLHVDGTRVEVQHAS